MDWIATLLLALVLPGSLYLAVITLAGSLPVRAPSALPMRGRLAMVVPAHDEAEGIARTLDNLLALARADGEAEVIVVADNCSDATAAIARHRGARVMVRHDTDRRGKGYALDHAFKALLRDDFAAFAVVDADSLADANFLTSLRRHFGSGALALQTRYTVLNAGDSPRTRLAELALFAFNVLRPRGRDRLGVSVGILGNGFALRREVLLSVPYAAASVVEDLEYHLRLISAGIRVRFADDTAIRGEMPAGGQGTATQRARWEGGRLRMLLDHGPTLCRQALSGRAAMIEPLADLLLPPLAYHLMLLLALLAMPLAWARWAALLGMLVVALHVLAAARVGHLPWRRLLGLAHLPVYLIWKLGMLASTLRTARKGSAWQRTQRQPR